MLRAEAMPGTFAQRTVAVVPGDVIDIPMLRRTVGLRLRLHRQRAGMSQKQVAEATGWSLSAVSMYEQGNREMSYERLLRTASLYGVSVGDFFHDGRDSHAARLAELEARVRGLEHSRR